MGTQKPSSAPSALDAADAELALPALPSALIDSAYLRRIQRRAALLTVLVPTTGALVALLTLPLYGVGSVELGLLVALHLATMLGITVGYHRLLAHHAFRAGAPVRAALVVLGAMAAQGPPIHWVSNHRRHHQLSDTAGDMHSPHAPQAGLRGFWHAHVGWMFTADPTNPARYSRDLLQDPVVRTVNKTYAVWVALGLLLPAVIGGCVGPGGLRGAALGFLWGGLVRIFTVHHATWSINSLTHLVGRRLYETSDRSTNVAWLAIPSAGESWHNAHHAFPSSARFGLEWWQVDLGWWLIGSLRLLGLVSEVHTPSPDVRMRRSADGIKNEFQNEI